MTTLPLLEQLFECFSFIRKMFVIQVRVKQHRHLDDPLAFVTLCTRQVHHAGVADLTMKMTLDQYLPNNSDRCNHTQRQNVPHPKFAETIELEFTLTAKI